MKTRKFLRYALISILMVMALVLVGCDDFNTAEYDESQDVIESHLGTWKEQNKFAKRILKDPTTFDTDFGADLDSLEITITESPDGKVKFYTWWNGVGGTMQCNNNIYQTKLNNKVYAYDWRDTDSDNYYPGFPLAIRQVETNKGTVYLLIAGFTEWSSCHAYEILAFRLNKRGELIPAKVFVYNENTDIIGGDDNTELIERVGVEIYGITPPSLYANNGWMDNFFFDLTKNDIYLYDQNDWYHHYIWNGEIFEYRYTTFNPALKRFIDPSYYLACEFELEKLFVRIDKYQGTYRYISWNKDSMFISNPEIVITNGWYHEQEKMFHFTNNNYEYIYDLNDYHLRIYKTDSKTGVRKEIANYEPEYTYDDIE